jgi:hypothetical protein
LCKSICFFQHVSRTNGPVFCGLEDGDVQYLRNNTFLCVSSLKWLMRSVRCVTWGSLSASPQSGAGGSALILYMGSSRIRWSYVQIHSAEQLTCVTVCLIVRCSVSWANPMTVFIVTGIYQCVEWIY